jgi:hypothetical protein
LFRVYGPQLLRWRGRAPIVVMDHEDMPVINRNSLYLLDRCRLWFKRELPVDHWRVFMKTAHANLPTPRFRLARRNRARVAKLRPISLGFKLGIELPDTAATAAKTVDVFFAGRIEGCARLASSSISLKALCPGTNSTGAAPPPGWSGRRRATAGTASATTRRRPAARFR